MTYTIKEIAERYAITTHTLRYYDKEGLLPFIQRDAAGNRIFTEEDLGWISMIICLKETGMPIKEIRQYIDLSMLGDSTLEERRQIFIAHRQHVLEQIACLGHNLEKIDRKIRYYEESCALYQMENSKRPMIGRPPAESESAEAVLPGQKAAADVIGELISR